MFSLICVWINGWVNNREAGDLRRYLAHYDVTVMFLTCKPCVWEMIWKWLEPGDSALELNWWWYYGISLIKYAGLLLWTPASHVRVVRILPFNTLASGRCGSNTKIIIFKLIMSNSSLGTCCDIVLTHDDVIKWKHFSRYWPFVRSPVNSPHKASDAELWCFLWSAPE